MQQVGRCDRSDFLAGPLPKLGNQLVARLAAFDQRDIGIDALTLDVVRISDNGRFRDLWMGDKGGFDFSCSHPVAGDVQNVVNAAGDPEIAILIAARAVTREIASWEGGEISLDETLMVAIDGAHLAWPGMRDAQIAVNRAVQLVVVAIHQDRLDAEERACCRAWLGSCGTGKRCDQDAAGLGLPPGIDDWATAFANHLVIPHPGFRIDRFADASQKTERGAVAPRHRRIAFAH